MSYQMPQHRQLFSFNQPRSYYRHMKSRCVHVCMHVSCLCVSLCACPQTVKTLPALAAVPPVDASPPSSSSACGSPAVCVCGRCAPSEILLHKSGSAGTRHQHVSVPISKPYVICRFLSWSEYISERCRATTWWCNSPSDLLLQSIKQIFPRQQ